MSRAAETGANRFTAHHRVVSPAKSGTISEVRRYTLMPPASTSTSLRRSPCLNAIGRSIGLDSAVLNALVSDKEVGHLPKEEVLPSLPFRRSFAPELSDFLEETRV